MSRRNLWIPDDLYDAVKAAAERDAKKGEPASLSAWVRQAIREKLERSSTTGSVDS